MGLFAGMSVISIVEVGFFIVQASIVRLMKLRSQQIAHEIIKVAPVNLVPGKKSVFSRCSDFIFTIMNKSDIHGLRYIVKTKKSVGGRLFWLMTVVISSMVCFWQIFNTVKHSETNPIEIGVDQKIWDVKNVRL